MDAKETRIYIAILSGLAILGAFLLFFIVTIVRNHKRKFVLIQQQVLEQMTSLEVERARLARDLHDSFGALLATVKLHLQCIEHIHINDAIYIAKALENLDIINEKVRDISMSLTPQILERKGLLAAIKDLAEGIHSNHFMRIKVIAEQASFPFQKEVEIHMYRIVQEMITNAMKHASATEMTIQVCLQRNWIVLQVHDNGKGFTMPDCANQLEGFGLQSISGRVALLQGRIQLETRPGEGTRYTIELPIQTP
jgi:signal transduction histidine kinase